MAGAADTAAEVMAAEVMAGAADISVAAILAVPTSVADISAADISMPADTFAVADILPAHIISAMEEWPRMADRASEARQSAPATFDLP
jgi:hypothetical protein